MTQGFGTFVRGGTAHLGFRSGDTVVDLGEGSLDELLPQGRAAWERATEQALAAVDAGDAISLDEVDAAAAVHRRGLRRLLLLARARDEPRPDVPARLGAAAAELAPPAGRLPRPGRHGRRQRHADQAAAGAGEAAGRGRARLRPVAAPRHRARARLRRRRAERAGRAGADERVRRSRLRRRARQRLERARHPGLGVRPARAVPRQVVRHLGLRVGDAAGAARGSPRRRAAAGAGAVATPSRRGRLGARPAARGGAERRRDLARERARPLLDDAAAARTRDVERGEHPHRRPDGVGNDLRRRARQRGQPDRADVERQRAGPARRRRRADVPRGRRRGGAPRRAAGRGARPHSSREWRGARSSCAALRHPASRASSSSAATAPGGCRDARAASSSGVAKPPTIVPAFERRLRTRPWLLRQIRFDDDEATERIEDVFELAAARPGWQAPAHGRWIGRSELDGLRLCDEEQRELLWRSTSTRSSGARCPEARGLGATPGWLADVSANGSSTRWPGSASRSSGSSR